MTSDRSNYWREYSPDGSHSVLKTSTEYSFVFYKCLFVSDKSMLDLDLRRKSLILFRQNNDNSVKY